MSALGLGLLLGVGVVLVLLGAPPLRRPSVAQRIDPYLGVTAGAPGRAGARTGRGSGGARVRELVGRSDRLWGDRRTLQARLDAAGDDRTVEDFRVELVAWATGGLAVAAMLLALRAGSGGAPEPVPALVLLVVGAVAGVLVRDHRLAAAGRRRREAMALEFPTLAELLALAVSAGESVGGAVSRVSRVGHGHLVGEFGQVEADLRAGVGLHVALDAMARRVDLAEVTRFVAAVGVAVDRGTPLAPVLQAQASDAREASRRQLIEAGGRKEIAMMVPVVFLVLPVSVVFALFPGFYGLSLSAP